MEKFCNQCGHGLEDNARVCGACGQKVRRASLWVWVSLGLFVCLLLLGMFCIGDAITRTNNNVELQNKIVSLENSYKDAQNAYKNVQDAYDNVQNRVKSLNDLNDSLAKQLAEEKEKNKTPVDNLEEKIAELNTQISGLNTQISGLDSQIKSKQEQLDNLTKEVDQALVEENRKATEGVTVYEDAKVKINYVKIRTTTNYLGDKAVVFLVENKTDATITIQCETLALDGITIDDYISMSDEVAAKSKGYVYAEAEAISNHNPSFLSGELKVCHFGDTLDSSWSYRASFVNIPVS